MKRKSTAKRLEKIFGSKVGKPSGSCAPVSGSAAVVKVSPQQLLEQWQVKLKEFRELERQATGQGNIAMRYWHEGFADALDMVTRRP